MPSRASGSRRKAPDAVDNAERARVGRAVRYRTIRILKLLRNAAIVILVLVGLGVAGAVGIFIYYGSDPKLPTLRSVADYRPKQLTKVLDREGKVIGELGGERRTLIPFDKIPKVMIEAVVASEDADFFKHSGIDYRAIVRAAITNMLNVRYAQGFSTITQQVVKQMLLTPEKTLRRKVQEVILARTLTDKLTKQEILEIYLNHMYFGHGRYGCEEASQYYFGKPIAAANAAEVAMLAGLLQSPERLSPRKHPEAAKTRQRYVLGQMAHEGFIDKATADKLAAQPIVLAPESVARISLAPEAVDIAYKKLVEANGAEAVTTLGAAVKTTIDAKLQELARQAVERGLEDLDLRQGYRGPTGHLTGKALEKHKNDLARKGAPKAGDIVDGVVEKVEKEAAKPKGGRLFVDVGGTALGVVDLDAETRYGLGPKPLAERFKPGDLLRVRSAPERKRGAGNELPLALELGPQAAMVVMDPQTRDILALVGGYAYHAGGFDRSQRAMRQPGSAFKPFVYAAAIESRKFTAATVVNDAPEVYDLWKPQNYEKEVFRGPVRLRTALAHSINTVAIRVMAELGLPTVREYARLSGITSDLPDSLGLAAALGASSVSPIELANAYATFAAGGLLAEARLLTDVGGKLIEAAQPQPALRPETAYVVVSLMRSVVEEGTAKAASTRLRRPLAGKTGTTNDQKDAWFVGFSPDLLAAVWVGFDDGRKLGKGEAGGRTALPIWIEFMAKALANRPVRDFAQPRGVVVTQIDPNTGLLASPGTEGVPEVFLEGTQPKEAAPAHGEEANPDKLLLESQ